MSRKIDLEQDQPQPDKYAQAAGLVQEGDAPQQRGGGAAGNRAVATGL